MRVRGQINKSILGPIHKKQKHEFVRHELNYEQLDHHYVCVFSYEWKCWMIEVRLNCQRNHFGCNSLATSDKISIRTHATRNHLEVSPDSFNVRSKRLGVWEKLLCITSQKNELKHIMRLGAEIIRLVLRFTWYVHCTGSLRVSLRYLFSYLLIFRLFHFSRCGYNLLIEWWLSCSPIPFSKIE